VLGQGGLIDAGIGIYEDLQSNTLGGVIGAVQKALNVNQTLKKTPLSNIIRNDANLVKQDVLRNSLPGAMRNAANSANSMLFPKSVKTSPTTTLGKLGTDFKIGNP
jgi:hypothetical protein